MKTVLFFGIYDPSYSRSRVLKDGFKENGWSVDECRVDPKITKGISKYFALYKLARSKKRNHYDMVIVCFPGQMVAWIARLVFGPDIIFDAFVSMYDSNVFDRQVYGKYSLRAFRDYFFDWFSARLARHVLLDTFEHIKFYSKTFHIPESKFIRVLVGSHEMPEQNKTPVPGRFVVEFHGTFIPLQGIEHIIKAAHLLKKEKDIVFTIIGDGQTYKECRKLADELQIENIHFIGRVPFEKIAEFVADADVCLGIFGDTPKTLRVIPNKVYECVAIGKPVITADSLGEREVFTDGKDIVFAQVSNPESLAEKILFLKNNPELRLKIGKQARATFMSRCIPSVLVKAFIEEVTPH